MENNYVKNRQNTLYNYLVENYDEEAFIPKAQIVNDLDCYNANENETRFCRTMELDVRAINSSDEYDKIIVSNRIGYKIGNKAQVSAYLKRLFKRDFKSLKRNWLLTKKKGLNGQAFFDDLDITQDINTVETFMKSVGV